MRVLILSFVLALPLASIASASDEATVQSTPSTVSAAGGVLERRTIGLGIGQDLAYVGIGNGSSLVDETTLRWQASRRFALEPSVQFGARQTRFAAAPLAQAQSVLLGTRLRVTAASHGAMHLVGLVGVSGSLGRLTNLDVNGEQLSEFRSVSVRATTGLGIEYAPKRWWSLGADYRVTMATVDRVDFGADAQQEAQLSGQLGPTNAGRLVATAHVYF